VCAVDHPRITIIKEEEEEDNKSKKTFFSQKFKMGIKKRRISR
jgi:hypothetical protein